jgi:DnaJ like chaperone protein
MSPLNWIRGLYARLGEMLAFAWARRALQPHLHFLFSSLGRIAKSSGQVLPVHIQYAEAVLSRLSCKGRARARAIEWFNQGKTGEADFHQLAVHCNAKPTPSLHSLVLDCMVHMYEIKATPAANRSLHFLGSLLGFEAARITTRRDEVHLEEARLNQARAVLGLDEGATPKEIRLAYRQLASRHHPDKLGPDASAKEQEHAVTRSVEIRAAYDVLLQATGGRSAQ